MHQNYKFKQSNQTRKVVSKRNLSSPESSVPTLANHKLTAESVPALYGSFNRVSTSKTDILLDKHLQVHMRERERERDQNQLIILRIVPSGPCPVKIMRQGQLTWCY